MFALKKGKAFEKRESRPKSDKPRREKSDKDKKPRGDRKHGRKDQERKPQRPRMVSAEAKINPADSPFAILGQLKKAGKDGA